MENHQYTAEGVRNIGGAAVNGEGKTAKDVECIEVNSGARSQGAMAGSAITAGVAVPAVMNIPYVGWLAAGWATLLVREQEKLLVQKSVQCSIIAK